MKKAVGWCLCAVMASGCGAGSNGSGGVAGDGAGSREIRLLETLDAAFVSEPFAVVQTVRELPDGRVLVADPLGQVVVAIDMDAGTADTIGTVGEGPDEYQQPDAVWPLPDGKTLLVDLGNSRLTELSPELEFGKTRPFVLGSPMEGNLMMAVPAAVDGRGDVYFRGIPSPDETAEADSAVVLRFAIDTESVDSVARIGIPAQIRQGDGNNVSVSPVPLSPADAWGVAPDGRFVIARAGDYHVEWISSDGTVTRGAPVEYEPLPIGRDEKEAWLALRGESGGGLTIQMLRADDGLLQVSVGRGGAPSDDVDLDSYVWPEYMPPFLGSRINVDSEGRAWVRAARRAGDQPAYDVFDASGTREMVVRLMSGSRVIGFGNGKVYVVRMDSVGLQYLERYPLP